MPQCQRCHSETTKFIYTPVKMLWVCDSCASHYQMCTKCSYYFTTGSLSYIRGYLYCSECLKELSYCHKCNERIPKVNYSHEGNFYCVECYNELTIKCYHCEDETKLASSYEKGGEEYCENCYYELFAECFHCGDVFLNDEMHWVDDEAICDGCYEKYYCECDACDTITKKINAHYFDGVYYCDDCFWEYYTECQSCGDIMATEDSYYSEVADETLCDDCYGRINSVIKPYEYRPNPLFHTSSGVFDMYHYNSKYIYYGFELEVEDNKGRVELREMAEMLEEKFGEFIYFKWDSSLNDGFEIVSHPFTWEWYKKNRKMLKEMLELLIKNGYCSYYSERAAIHIHISKKPFKTFHLFKLLEFYYGHPRLIKLLSRIYHKKQTSQHIQWDWQKYSIKYTAKYKSHDEDMDRYQMVNFVDGKTIEFRSFRGTLIAESFFRILELIKCSIDYCEESSIKDITNLYPKFYNYVKGRQKEFRNLYSFLSKRKEEVRKRCV